MPRQPANAEIQARYTKMAAKNRWEEQGFFFDDGLENYGLEPTIHNRLRELGCNDNGEDNVTVRRRRVVANSATINEILGLPNNEPSIYALLQGLEEEDYETIKDFLCEQDTEWNTTGKNPHSDDKEDVSTETTGPAQADITVGLQISAERLAVLLAYP
ncbi:hypothetical protein V6N13_121669 [Hibiscus sabdariffa]